MNWKRTVRRLLHPAALPALAVVLSAAALLAAVFTLRLWDTPIAYFAYPYSTYALAILIARFADIVDKVRTRLRSSRYTRRLFDDYEFRAGSMLYGELFVNALFSLTRFLSGFAYRSVWDFAVGAYHLVLAALRFSLLRGARLASSLPAELRHREAWRGYIRAGTLIVILSPVMGGMIVQMTFHGRTFDYPGVLIYAFAAFSFYSLGVAIANLVRRRRERNLLLAAARRVALACAVMSVYGLQTALLTRFGAQDPEAFRLTMNIVSGAAVCLITFAIGAGMCVTGRKAIRDRC